MKNNISEITEDILTSWLKENKEPKFRCKQILDWIYKKQVEALKFGFDRLWHIFQKIENWDDPSHLPHNHIQ